MSTIIEMPKLSDTMTVGTVVKWYKSVGEKVENGDILAEIETDKATMELENFDDGILLQLLAQEGDEVKIGKPLAIIGEDGEEIPDLGLSSPHEIQPEDETHSVLDKSPDFGKAASPVASKLPSTWDKDNSLNQNDSSDRILASPLAKKMAREQGIDLAQIKGSGPRGRITKKDLSGNVNTVGLKDVVSFGVPPSPQPTQHTSALHSKSVPVSKMRSVIAKRLLESKTTIPHFYLQKEINSEPLRKARASINRRLESLSISSKVSINDIIIHACARAIPFVPEINTSWSEKDIIFHGDINLAFGVAVDDGLVTPVIMKADHLGLLDLSNEAKSLIEKSRNRKLTPAEMSGSTFTITNLGMYGIDFFSGIINPPNAAILAVGSSMAKPVITPDGSIQAGETMILGLSCDHRLIDGASGARFLQVLAELLENPASMLV
jgi:pyruvate dehydrogenase E2 component (dihydrolipoamide acetyltransferase)